MVLVFSEHISPRHSYIFDLIFKDVLGVDMDLTGDPKIYLAWDGPKFSYATESPDGGMLFRPSGLLEETGIHGRDTVITDINGLPVGFEVRQPSALPYDPFAYAFYLVARYEEYLPFEEDGHGRFPAHASVASQYGFLDRPVVNIIAHEIWKLLTVVWPGIEERGPSWKFIPTFDVDIAYAHLGKGFVRSVGGFARLLMSLDMKELGERLLTMAGKKEDPYDTFAFLQEITEDNGLEPVYFFLLGDPGPYDRNLSHRSIRMRRLIRQLSEKAAIGIHPSYSSFLDKKKIMEEIRRLEDITGKAVTASRQHFLRVKMPDTFRVLMECGITDDHSMGYSTVTGFRAGISTPYYFFDLPAEEATSLRMHPFAFMDSALTDQMKLSGPEAFDRMKTLAGEVMKYGGEAVGIWHNYALSEKGDYRGARGQLERLFNFVNGYKED